MGLFGWAARAAVEEIAASEQEKRAADPRRWWITRGILAGFVLVGWLFILWQNKFHVSPPLVFVCLGYLAAVALVVNLWRAGAAAAKPDDAEAIASWDRPIGPRIDLEREKKTLLKAIKEAEFDHQMGKLSKGDADHMVAVYRARAIEIIKALEKDTTGLSVREKIEREVRARLEVEGKTKKKVDSDVVAAEGKQHKKQQAKQAKQDAKQAKADTDDKPAVATAVEPPTETTPEKPTEPDRDAMVTQSESTPAKEATS